MHINRTHHWTCVSLVVASLLAAASPRAAHAQRRYAVKEVPTGDFAGASPSGLNDAGHVIGIRENYEGPAAGRRGFFWSPETGTLDLGVGAVPTGINRNGLVVGYRTDAGGPMSAFMWTREGGFRNVIGPGSDAFDVNDAGQITGHDSLGAFVRDADGTVRRLPLPAGALGPPSGTPNAFGISRTGDVVGRVTFPDGSYRAAVWPAGGGVRLLDDLPAGPTYATAERMSIDGTISGSGFVEPVPGDGTGQRAVVWTPEGFVRDLGMLPGMTYSGAGPINDRGEVVGFSGTGTGNPWRAFLWTESEGMLDLNDLLEESGRGWLLSLPSGINNAGQIAAFGWKDGSPAVALLTPVVPEPSMVGLVAASLLLRLRRPSARRRALAGTATYPRCG